MTSSLWLQEALILLLRMLVGPFAGTSDARACVTGAMPTTQLQHEKHIYAAPGDDTLRPNQKRKGEANT